MIYLNPPTTAMLPYARHPNVGIIITPDSDRPNLYNVSDFPIWAADNGCYAAGERFDAFRYLVWLTGLRRFASTCLFATAPDVVGDAHSTWERSRDWLGCIRTIGFRAALVAQDGFRPDEIDPTLFDTLFIGGTTEFKLGRRAELAIHYAQILGKSTHVGRVNSARRYEKFANLGVTSADGTFIKFGPDTNIPKMLEWTK